MKSLSDFEQLRMLAHPDQRWGCATFAQHGDDLMLVNLFELLGVARPSYLDLGAHHPFIISNTALLYERGSRGVNVEANPNLIAAFKRYRPEDKNINVGVGLTAGHATFYMYSETSGRNTFSSFEVEAFKAKLPVRKTIELPVYTLADIIRTACDGRFPDLLMTDLEGLDYAILESANFSKSRPRVIVTEVRRGDGANMKMLMQERGYFCYCRMGENLFFVQEDDKPLVY